MGGGVLADGGHEEAASVWVVDHARVKRALAGIEKCIQALATVERRARFGICPDAIVSSHQQVAGTGGDGRIRWLNVESGGAIGGEGAAVIYRLRRSGAFP